MALQDTDIVIYGSTNMQENNTATPQGGSINTAIKMTFVDITGTNPSPVDIVSNNVSDSGSLVVTGRTVGGSIATDTIALLGTGIASGVQNFERILKIYETGHIGTLTITAQNGGYTLATLESGVEQVRRPFYSPTGNIAGGADLYFYEKVFIKNNSTGNDLLSMTIGEGSDGMEAVSADITFAIETGLNGTGVATNRITSPDTGVLLSGEFSDNTKSLPGDNLTIGDAIGVWLRLYIPAGTTATNTTFSFDINGATT